jgi:hypothetical protein
MSGPLQERLLAFGLMGATQGDISGWSKEPDRMFIGPLSPCGHRIPSIVTLCPILAFWR